MAYETKPAKIKLTEAAPNTTPTQTQGQLTIYDDGIVTYDNTNGKRIKFADEKAERAYYYGSASIKPSPDSWFTYTENAGGETVTWTGLSAIGKTQAEIVIPYKLGGKLINHWSFLNPINHNNSALTKLTIPNTSDWLVGSAGGAPLLVTGSSAIIEVIVSPGCLDIAPPCYIGAPAKVTLPDSIRTLADGTLNGSANNILHTANYNLGSLSHLQEIPNGFLAYSDITYFEVPESVTSIKVAFQYCSKLKYVRIPPTVTSISDTAFMYCPNLTIICDKGSYAATWAQADKTPANKIPISYDSIPKTDIDTINSSISSNKSDIAKLNATKANISHQHSVYSIENSPGNSAGFLSPIHRNFVDTSGTNATAFMPVENVVIEYTTDAGATWNEYTTSDTTLTKQRLFGQIQANDIKIGGPNITNDTITSNCWTRVTVEPKNRYARVDMLYCWFTTAGSSGNTVTIECSTIGDPDTFTVVKSATSLSGWPGPNMITFGAKTFGGGASQVNNQYKFRFIFKAGTGGKVPSFGDLRMYSYMVWSAPNSVVRQGVPYNTNQVMEVSFPKNLTADKDLQVKGNLTVNGIVNGTASKAKQLTPGASISIKQAGATKYTSGLFDGTKEVKIDLPDVPAENVTGLHKVATSGSYTDLNNIPVAGTSSTLGLTKLYTRLGNNEDGAVTQKLVKAELDKKANLSDLTTVFRYKGQLFGSAMQLRSIMLSGCKTGDCYNIGGTFYRSDFTASDVDWSVLDVIVTDRAGSGGVTEAFTVPKTDGSGTREVTAVCVSSPAQDMYEIMLWDKSVLNNTEIIITDPHDQTIRAKIAAIRNGQIYLYPADESISNFEQSGTSWMSKINFGPQWFWNLNIGDNIVWSGQYWDKLSGTVDLTPYATKTYLDEQLAGLEAVIDEVRETQKSYMCEIIRWSDSDTGSGQSAQDSTTGGVTA